MSNTSTFLRTSAIATAAIAGLTLTACASNGSQSDNRYANSYGNAYGYETGGSACAPQNQCAPTGNARYGNAAPVYAAPAPVYAAPRTENVIYADCSVINGLNCGPTYQPAPTQVYTAPAATYAAPTYSAPTYSAPATSYGSETAPCPAGTVSNGDGTCMQSSSSYSSSSSYTAPSYSSATTSYASSSYGGETAPCPAGTVSNGDGTCMQSSSSYTTPSYSSATTYSSNSYSGETAACPAGTTQAADGTCLQGGSYGSTSYSNSNIEIFNDATSSTYGGYSSSGGYSANDYLPVRK